MQHFASSILFACLLFANAGLLSAADEETVKKVYKETNGTWKLVSSIKDGTPRPVEDLEDIRMELKDGQWTARKGKELINIGSYKILSVKEGIRTVAAEVLKGKDAGNAGTHISKSNGDTLTICRKPNSKVAPKEFTSKKGSGHVLNVWKRVK